MIQLDKFLSFVLGDENFAIPLLKVREVIALPEITPVPKASQHVLGIMNLRGQIITIFDMRSCLKLKSMRKEDLTVVICDMEFGQIGFVVDAVTSVLSVTNEQLSEVPPGSRAAEQSYITRIHRKDDELTLVLDVEQLLSVEARIQVQSLNQKTA
jgi:purine-binding chemotaxis protein CheW